MTKRMHFYLNYYKELLEKDLSPEKAQQEKENLLVQIQFFQHERLIHLIVTALFALLTVITLRSNLFLMRPLLVVLEVFLLILLVLLILIICLLRAVNAALILIGVFFGAFGLAAAHTAVFLKALIIAVKAVIHNDVLRCNHKVGCCCRNIVFPISPTVYRQIVTVI